VDEVDLIIAGVPSAEDPHDLGSKVMSAGVDLMDRSVVASGVYRLWGAPTDWFRAKGSRPLLPCAGRRRNGMR